MGFLAGDFFAGAAEVLRAAVAGLALVGRAAVLAGAALADLLLGLSLVGAAFSRYNNQWIIINLI